MTALALIKGAAGAQPVKPNVIFIFADQHRMGDFPGEPHTSVIAPNLDRLSREGARFVNAISNYPVCSPYRAMLMSGRAPFVTGVVENRIILREKGESFGDVFRSAGYRTGYIGKWHLGGEDRPRQGMHGFEHFQPWIGTSNHRNSRYWDIEGRRYLRETEYNATKMIDQGLEFIDEVRDEPFLLMVSLNPPHSNYFDAPERFKELYREKALVMRPNVPAKPDPRFGTWTARNGSPEHMLRGSLAHVSAIDHEMGRVLEYLDQHGLAENTLLVYSSDHGDMLGSHGRMGKRQPFEESIRIPFVVRWKGAIQAGLRPDTLIGVIDFLPTIAGLAKVPVPEDLDGKDLAGVLRGETIEEPAFQPIMHVFRDLAGAPNHPAEIFRGVRTKRFTYAATIARHFVLFDLGKDPYQKHNLIDDPAYRAERDRLSGLTQQWLDAWDDPFRLP